MDKIRQFFWIFSQYWHQYTVDNNIVFNIKVIVKNIGDNIKQPKKYCFQCEDLKKLYKKSWSICREKN